MKRVLSIILSLALIMSVIGTIPMTASAASMSDADFFSKFDLTYSGMEDVKAAVDSGDYAAAKKEFVKYLSERKAAGEAQAFPITEAHENYGQAVLPLDNILTGPYEFDVWLNRFTVTSKDYTLYEIDLTEKTAQELNNQAISVMLFERQKQAFPVLVASKEYAGFEPVLVVETAEGDTYEITANNDTYVNSGATSTTYGDATELYVKEQSDSLSSPFGSQTKRAYINFSLEEAANKTIEKATMKLYARLAEDATVDSLDVHVISVGDTLWNENTLTWSAIGGNIYSYQNADVPTWQSPSGSDSEYQNVTARFWYARSMAYEYLTYLEDPVSYAESHPLYPDGSIFGEKLISLMDAFATQKSYGFNRTLETGERLNRWVDILDALVDTPAVQNNPDKICNIVSFMWGDCNYLAGLNIADGGPWWSNWRIVANAGFYKGNEYFPEWKNYSTWRNKVDYNVNYTLDLLFENDMSFAEAGPAYAVWCVELFGDCMRMAELNGRPMDKTFTEKLRYAARFALESIYPDGYDSNIGDSNYKDRMSVFADLAEFYGNDSILNAFVNGDDEGAEYFTSIYEDSNTMLMRNSWDPEEAVYLQFNNNPFDGHSHYDSNSVVMYAYGKPLLVDSGRYSYSSFNTIRDELKLASSHNTVEAVGVSMATHSSAAKSLEYATTNDVFDFATSSQTGYSGATHTRNVMYLKDGYAIVTDYVTGSANREYRQNWHFMPSSNAEMDGNTATTNFYNEANIVIANAGSDTAVIRDGYHSADYGLVAGSKYASYGKSGSEVKFDTVLYPTRAGESADVVVTDLDSDNSKVALEIIADDEISYYYVKNTDDADGEFGDYETDAKMAYIADGKFALVDGTNIAGVVESNNIITSMVVTYEGEAVRIEGENLVVSTDMENAIAINVEGGVSEVYLNGEKVENYSMQGGYLYAVRSTAVKGEFTVNGKEYNIVGENLAGDLEDLTNATGGKLLDNWQLVTNANYSESGRSVRTTTLGGGGTVYAMRTFFPIEGGKSYLVRNSIYNNTGSATASHSNAGMSAIIATGASVYSTFKGLTMYSHVEYGGFNSWSDETDPTYVGSRASRTDYVTQPGLNKVEVIINAPAEAENIMISYGAWGSTELYYGDFEIYELEEVVNEEAVTTTVTVEFVDGVGNTIADSVTENVEAGEIYIYEAPETITYNDEYFVIDEEDSTLSCRAAEGENTLKVVYNRVGLVTVKHVAEDGTALAEDETYESGIGAQFDGSEYAKSSIIYESKVYNYANEADDVITVSAKISENVIELVYVDSAEEFDGKLAHFTFDDEETGFATKYAKATATGTNVLSSDSMKGNSLYLNGTGANYLNITDADGNALLTGLEEVTVVFYAKVAGSGANWSVFMAPNTNTQTYQSEHYIGMLHNGGNLTVERFNNAGSRATAINTAYTQNEWVKYALVIEEGQTTVYVDGVKTTLASSHKLTDILGSSSVIQIGKANWGSGEYFNGYIDDLMIFNYALTEDQILALDSEASNVTISYVDEDGNKVADDATTALLIGETLVEGKVQHDKLIVNDAGSYIFKEIEGLGAVADGKDIAVKVVYYNAANYKATKGDSMKSANANTTGFASETGSEYSARLMTDNRWNKRAGVMGFEVSVLSYATVEKAYVRLHVNDASGTTGAALYDASALADTWTRGNVTGFDLPAAAIAAGTVSGDYVVFDVTDYVVDGNIDFAVYTTTDQEYIIYDSENTDYKPELIVATTEDKSVKFEIADGKAVYTSYDGATVTVMVAYYDKDGALIKAVTSTDNTETVFVTIEQVEGAVEYKALVWNSASLMKPIMNPIMVTVE